MIDELQQLFRRHFGRPARVVARAPGRVNWIGEHTDYNEGLVLPCAIDRATWVAVAERDDGRFRCVSRERGEGTFRSGDPAAVAGATAEARTGRDWLDYSRGVVAALREGGSALPGADLAVCSDLPLGAGLSSSAALTVGLVTAFDACFGLGLGPRERAACAQRAECDFAGVPCGPMDPMASALGREGHLLRLDCRSLDTELVPVPEPERLVLLVLHSGVERRLAARPAASASSGGYAGRRGECARALALAREAGLLEPAATALRDLAPAALPALEGVLPEPLFRRVRHVVRENARVDATCRALRAGDLAAVGSLLDEGMASLRDDFEVSLPELDLLCELARATPGVYGSRLTGAGFGGCTLHLVAAEAALEAEETIARGFEARFGRRPPAHRVRPADGASVVAL